MAGNTKFHSEPFNEATLTKLTIYEEYLSRWLPVFVNHKPNTAWASEIRVFDFFCGPGKDAVGREGSPIIAVKTCLRYADKLAENGKTVTLFFNDSNQHKIEQLEQELSEFELPPSINCITSCSEFTESLYSNIDLMRKAGNLLFIDQFGIKHVNQEVFNLLTSLKQTDLMFFISSSFIARFKDTEEFKKHLDFSEHFGAQSKNTDVHRAVANMYREMLPEDSEYYIAPFTLKKEGSPNIYGLVFGTSNLLGILKFLETTWSIDIERGEANFDIDDDRLASTTGQFDLFNNNDKSTKVQSFQKDLEELLLKGQFQSDKDIFKYSVERGFIPTKHAKEIVQKLCSEGKIKVKGRLRLGKDCIKNPRAVVTCSPLSNPQRT